MVNGEGLALGSIAGLEVSGVGRIMGVETSVQNELVEVGGLRKVTEGGLVRWSWVDGSWDRMWKPSLRICLRWWSPR